jgi:ribosomal silencing factor RsfS
LRARIETTAEGRSRYSRNPRSTDFPASQWIVLDYLQVIVHVFHHAKRAFYQSGRLVE